MSTVLLTVPQVADRLNVSRGTVYNLLESGELASLKVRGSRRVLDSSVEQYIAERIITPAGGDAT